jgi:hypothetical protein
MEIGQKRQTETALKLLHLAQRTASTFWRSQEDDRIY